MPAERTCIGCKTKREQRELLRLVCDTAGEVMVDPTGRAPGRGAYVCYDTRCFGKSFRAARLTSVFRRPVIAPKLDAACGVVMSAFRERLGSCLSIAQRAGKLASGHMSLRLACSRSRVTYMVLAEDASVQRAAEYRTWCADLNIPHVTMFSKDELGRRIGKASRSAVGLLDPRFRESFCATLTLLQTFEASLDCLEIGVGLMPQLKQAVDG
jgi:predicted RNA-binding protein YlxR (DUF448 family)